MLYDGREYRLNKHLGWRVAQDHAWVDAGKVDVYAMGGFTTEAGQPIAENHVVIMRIKDAKTMEFRGHTCYDSSTVSPDKCVPICAHTATNVALGVPTIKSSSSFPKLNVGQHAGVAVHPGQPFVEQAHYLVYDGKVYQWTSRRIATSEDKAA